MEHCYEYRDHLIIWTCHSERFGWHIFLEVPHGAARHVGPEDLASIEDAEKHIDAMWDAACDGLEADADGFGEYAIVEP